MFQQATTHIIKTNNAKHYVKCLGSGTPLLLLHGYPQTHMAWHKVAPQLAKHFSLVIPDLRGYGQSEGPEADSKHENYSKRTMAHDAVSIMQELGHDSFAVAGHDRGGRVAYRLAFDHPEKVSHLIALDIVPTLVNWDTITHKKALAMFHWSFLAQQAPIPEHMISRDPDFWTEILINHWIGKESSLEAQAFEEYKKQFHNKAVVMATCEDYRAGATCDVEHDRADYEAGNKIKCPTLIIWGEQFLKSRSGDILDIWREWAENVKDLSLDCGHFIAEEKPQECAEAILKFLQDH